MKKSAGKRFAIEIPVLCAAGVLLWVLVSRNTRASAANTVPDLCFSVGSVFLIRGIIALLSRSHAFSFSAESFRFVHRLYRGKKDPGEDPDVPKVQKNEPDRKTAPVYLTAGGLLIAVSVLTGFL